MVTHGCVITVTDCSVYAGCFDISVRQRRILTCHSCVSKNKDVVAVVHCTTSLSHIYHFISESSQFIKPNTQYFIHISWKFDQNQ